MKRWVWLRGSLYSLLITLGIVGCVGDHSVDQILAPEIDHFLAPETGSRPHRLVNAKPIILASACDPDPQSNVSANGSTVRINCLDPSEPPPFEIGDDQLCGDWKANGHHFTCESMMIDRMDYIMGLFNDSSFLKNDVNCQQMESIMRTVLYDRNGGYTGRPLNGSNLGAVSAIDSLSGKPLGVWFNDTIFTTTYPDDDKRKIAAHEAYHMAFNDDDDLKADWAADYCFGKVFVGPWSTSSVNPYAYDHLALAEPITITANAGWASNTPRAIQPEDCCQTLIGFAFRFFQRNSKTSTGAINARMLDHSRTWQYHSRDPFVASPNIQRSLS